MNDKYILVKKWKGNPKPKYLPKIAQASNT